MTSLSYSLIVFLLHAILVFLNFLPSFAIGSLPDASQEGLLEQFDSYATVTLFHYVVPPEITRATWEFASFQDREDCPSREVNIYLQHASYPFFKVDNASFPTSFYTKRSSLYQIKIHSAYQPSDSLVHPVYNPLPGSWFAVAYLSPFEQRHGLFSKCRYSLGSIALWTKADNVELLFPAKEPKKYRTKRHFSYYKFFVQDAVDTFKLEISNCSVIVRKPRPSIFANNCIDFVDIRANGLPFHDISSKTALGNLTESNKAVFVENRPHKSSMYYMIVVSHSSVTFNVDLSFFDCGEVGLYGKQQHDWYLDERGLKWSERYNSSEQPKEPESGFQLFSLRKKNKVLDDLKNNTSHDFNITYKDKEEEKSKCPSTFDFSRIENVNEFSVNYLLQGRSWYTKWLTVLDDSLLVTRFDTLDFTDLGGFVNINLMMDEKKLNNYMYQVVEACISKNRVPDLSSCDDEDIIRISDKSNVTLQSLKVIPFPEPAKWHLGFKVSCFTRKADQLEDCPSSLKAAMLSVDLHIQPCDYRPLHDTCGSYGVCAKATKSQFRFSSCKCFSGYRGWTCDEKGANRHFLNHSIIKTLLLTLSNVSFLPAILLAVYFGLHSEALIYSATMIFSTFYHLCDQEALSMQLPFILEKACLQLYVNKEVLQFCDFFTATLSFWITIVSLAKLPHRLVNFLNLFGVLLIAFLVQYNRTSLFIFVIPIPLGIVVLLSALQLKSLRRRKLFRPNLSCTLLFLPAILFATVGLILAGFVETSGNYAQVHSAWHVLMAISLLFFLPRCKRTQGNRKKTTTTMDDLGNARLRRQYSLEERRSDNESSSSSNSSTSVSDNTEELGMTMTTTSSSNDAEESNA